jgi:hypothetical protein
MTYLLYQNETWFMFLFLKNGLTAQKHNVLLPLRLLFSILKFIPPGDSIVISLSIMSDSSLSSLDLDHGMSGSTLAIIVRLKYCMMSSKFLCRSMFRSCALTIHSLDMLGTAQPSVENANYFCSANFNFKLSFLCSK